MFPCRSSHKLLVTVLVGYRTRKLIDDLGGNSETAKDCEKEPAIRDFVFSVANPEKHQFQARKARPRLWASAAASRAYNAPAAIGAGSFTWSSTGSQPLVLVQMAAALP